MQTRSSSKRIVLHDPPAPAAPSVMMDPNLWDMLPPELLLQIYNSSQINEFYKLRQVCKGWNEEARSRRCFTDSIPKPYFVLIHHNRNVDAYIELIGYNISAGAWMAMSLKARGGTMPTVLAHHNFDPIGTVVEPFTVEGLLFAKGCFHPSLTGECSRTPDKAFVFDMQLQQSILDFDTFGTFSDPAFPALRILRDVLPQNLIPAADCSAIGMMVDMSMKPHAVKLIVGTPKANTMILDSRTRVWEILPSRMTRNRPRTYSTYLPKTCTSCDGKAYIWADVDEIQVYSVAEDRWSTLDPPPHLDTCRSLGQWQNQVFAVTRTSDLSPTVWRLDRPHASWEKFAHMPADLWEFLTKPLAKIRCRLMKILNVHHSGEYVLLHMHIIPLEGSGPSRKPPRRHVLFSLENKRWEIVAVPECETRHIGRII